MALTASSIMATLAALGTTAIIGCGGSTPQPASPVDAKEVPGATDAKAGNGSCGATGNGSCGAKSDEPAKADAGNVPAADTHADVAAPDTTKDKSGKPADAAAPADDKAKTAVKKKTGGKKAGGQAGAASCGQGTCSAKK